MSRPLLLQSHPQEQQQRAADGRGSRGRGRWLRQREWPPPSSVRRPLLLLLRMGLEQQRSTHLPTPSNHGRPRLPCHPAAHHRRGCHPSLVHLHLQLLGTICSNPRCFICLSLLSAEAHGFLMLGCAPMCCSWWNLSIACGNLLLLSPICLLLLIVLRPIS